MSDKKVVVIGAGPGGYPAALRLAELGAAVTLVEKSQAGGVCLNWGCIPSKSYLDAAHRFHTVAHIGNLLNDGMDGRIKELLAGKNWDKIKKRRAGVIELLKNGLKKSFSAKKIEYIEGTASFADKNSVVIKTADGEIKKDFDYAVIAAGTEPFFPPPFDKHKDNLLDNNRVFDIPKLPSKAVIVGGGVIGVEFACFFNAMGIDVSIVELSPTLINGEEEQSCRLLATSFQKRGIKLFLGKKAQGISFEGAEKKITLDDGTTLSADEVLVCAGRQANLTELKLENAGLSWDRRGIKINGKFQTAQEHIFAVGDVNWLSMLAHSASAQGVCVAENIMGQEGYYNNDIVPKCIYTWPEIASVGLNKKEAEAKGIAVKQSRAFFAGNGRALTQEQAEGFVQIVSGQESGKVLGAQISGACATEMIHIFSVAISAGLTLKDMKKVIYGHPTLSESIHDALCK